MIVALLVGLGGGLAMFALIAALAVPLQRWSDRTGYYEGKRQAPLAKQLQLIACICVLSGLGTGFIYAGRVDGPGWLIVPGIVLYVVMVIGAAVIGSRMGRGAPRAPGPRGPRPRGFLGATLPRLALTYGRAFGAAIALPPTGIVLIVVGKTVFGLAVLAFGIVLWVVMLRVRPKGRRSAWPST
jgi:hypothetical protein